MRPADVARLLVLAAIWGGSFIFIRILAPVLGPIATTDVRVLIAGLALIAWLIAQGKRLRWRERWRDYAVIGVLNSGVPAILYAFAALHIPAGYSAVLNATAPLFGMLLGVLWLGDRPTPANLAGAALGITGVATLAGLGPTAVTPIVAAAIGACLAAAFCYALASVYVKRRAGGLDPTSIAGVSQLTVGLALLPAVAAAPPVGPITWTIVGCALALALLCGAVAYVLYYRLVTDIGAARALTVTFLIPLFGVLWARLFLGERLTLGALLGCALVVIGTMLVLRRRPTAQPCSPILPRPALDASSEAPELTTVHAAPRPHPAATSA